MFAGVDDDVEYSGVRSLLYRETLAPNHSYTVLTSHTLVENDVLQRIDCYASLLISPLLFLPLPHLLHFALLLPITGHEHLLLFYFTLNATRL